MKNVLPSINKKGFTLIELMVVIAIIAVLSLVGIAVFSGQAKNARDAKRKSDIIAISKAMEAQKLPPGAANYPAIATTFFSAGSLPVDPTNTVGAASTTCPTTCKYCYSLSATPLTNCSAAATFIDVPGTAPVGWTGSSTWSVCANLENGGSFCRNNAQ